MLDLSKIYGSPHLTEMDTGRYTRGKETKEKKTKKETRKERDDMFHVHLVLRSEFRLLALKHMMSEKGDKNEVDKLPHLVSVLLSSPPLQTQRFTPCTHTHIQGESREETLEKGSDGNDDDTCVCYVTYGARQLSLCLLRKESWS